MTVQDIKSQIDPDENHTSVMDKLLANLDKAKEREQLLMKMIDIQEQKEKVSDTFRLRQEELHKPAQDIKSQIDPDENHTFVTDELLSKLDKSKERETLLMEIIDYAYEAIDKLDYEIRIFKTATLCADNNGLCSKDEMKLADDIGMFSMDILADRSKPIARNVELLKMVASGNLEASNSFLQVHHENESPDITRLKEVVLNQLNQTA